MKTSFHVKKPHRKSVHPFVSYVAIGRHKDKNWHETYKTLLFFWILVTEKLSLRQSYREWQTRITRSWNKTCQLILTLNFINEFL